jgi:hypothetical protein
VQFADVIAGCIRSIIIKDKNYEIAIQFYKDIIKDGFIQNNKTKFINPNFIFYSEIDQEINEQIKEIWKL